LWNRGTVRRMKGGEEGGQICRLAAATMKHREVGSGERTGHPSRKRRVTVDEALAHLAGPESRTFATVFTHGSLQVEIYSPQKVDPQQPHSRDEIYVVVQGKGDYTSAAGRQPFESGDFLFAPAGEVHRFENFT